MAASRLALLTLLLGLALGAGIGFLLGGDARPVVQAADSTIARTTGRARPGSSSIANVLAAPVPGGRAAAPAGDAEIVDEVLTAAANDLTGETLARVSAAPAENGGAAGNGTITGAAFDENGAPLAGVTVVASNGEDPYTSRARGESTSAVGRAWSGPRDVDGALTSSAKSMLADRRRQRTATTDESGRFELTGLRSGRHSLSAYYEGLVFRGQQVHVGESARFIGTPVSEFRIELRLPDGSSPAEALLLVGEDRRPEAYRWTSEEPILRLSRPVASIKAIAGNVRAVEWRSYVSDFTSDVEVVDLDQDGEGPHLIELEARSLLRVAVEDTSGLEPRLDPWVKVVEASKAEGKEPEDLFDEAKSLERGWGDAFAIADLDEGAYLLGAGRGTGPAEVTTEIQLTGGVVEESITLGGVELSRFLVVRCTGPSGKKATRVSFRRRVEREGGSSSGGTSAITRGPGEYWIPFARLLDGKEWNEVTSVELTATAKGYGELITPVTRSQTEIDLAFQPSAELMVRVTGDTTPGFTVQAVSIVKEDSGNTRTLRSSRDAKRVDGEGTARITGLQPGLFRVELRKASQRNRGWGGGGGAIASQEMTIRPGTQEITFLAPTFHELVVYAPDLPKGTGFWLQRKGESNGGGGWWGGNNASLNDEHRATFKDVAAGQYTLNTWTGSGQSTMDVSVPSGEVLFEATVVNAQRVKSLTTGKLGERAGLLVGDVVFAVDGKEFDANTFWQRLTLDLETDAVRLTVERNGAVLDLEMGPGVKDGNVWNQVGVEWEPTSR